MLNIINKESSIKAITFSILLLTTHNLMAKSVSQIIGLDEGKERRDNALKKPSSTPYVAKKPQKETPKILSYLKQKTLNTIQLGNLEKKSNCYGLGVDYDVSEALQFSIDITAQQAFFNFIYKR